MTSQFPIHLEDKIFEIKYNKDDEIQKIISLKVSSLGFEVSTSVFITKAVKTLTLFVAKS